MNCHEHNEVAAVAACACGKALCSECARKHQPPTCKACYLASLTNLRSRTMTRLGLNVVFYFPYVMIMTGIHAVSDNLVLIMMLIWGFFGFRWLMDAFLSLTRMAIFASFEGWGMTYFIGSLVCSFTGFVVIPVQVVAQILQLRKLNESLKSLSDPLLAETAAMSV